MRPGPAASSGVTSRRLPTFLVIGAPKAGTTSLHEHLRRHPDVFMPTRKEPDFFSDDAAWREGVESYARLFRRAAGASAVGEASTSYTRYPHVPDVPARIAQVLPDVRLVYLVRHPIQRMVSQYRFRRAKGWEQRSIDEALSTDDTYIAPSRYAMQLERYLQSFPMDQILVIRSEDLLADPLTTVATVFAFVGVDPAAAGAPPETRLNTSEASALRRGPDRLRRAIRRIPGYRRAVDSLPSSVRSTVTSPFADRSRSAVTLSPETQARLRAVLRDDVDRLQRLLGRDLGAWDL
jgi:hypothetical protein